MTLDSWLWIGAAGWPALWNFEPPLWAVIHALLCVMHGRNDQEV